MGEVVTALRQAEAFGMGSGTLSDVSKWWLAPIDGISSLEDICRDSVAAKRLEQGLIEASHAYKHLPELMGRYFRFACACATGNKCTSDFVLPIWLDWIQQTADALRLWRECVSAMPNQELKDEFRLVSWKPGIVHIRSGRSRVAARTWREDARRIIDAADVRSAATRMALKELQLAADLAAEIGIDGPSTSVDKTNAEDIRRCLDHWWANTGDPALDRLFWDVHVPFLNRLRGDPLRHLAPNEKKAISRLIRSATEGRRPTFSEVHRLSLMHADVFQSLIAFRACSGSETNGDHSISRLETTGYWSR